MNDPKEKPIAYEDWLPQIAGSAFENLRFTSAGGTELCETGGFRIVPEHGEADKESMTVDIPGEGTVAFSMCLAIDNPHTDIDRIVANGDGFTIWLRNGDCVTVFGDSSEGD